MLVINSFCVICVLSGIILAQDASEPEDHTDSDRDLRQFDDQDWRALDYFSPHSETSGWVPQGQDASSSQENTGELPKRRRIRKRKRRPPVISLTDSEEPEDTFLAPFQKTRPRPVLREPWEEMEAEVVTQKPYVRRRLTPVFQEEPSEDEEYISRFPNSNTSPQGQPFERIRDPFTALQQEAEKHSKKQQAPLEIPQPPSIADLRNLIKQSGGLSLSEVLQQKNLSLSELLKGSRKAISALAENAPIETTTIVGEATQAATTKYRRLPPSIGLYKKHHQDKIEHTTQDSSLTSRELVEAQRKRLSLLHGHKDTKIYSDVTRFEVVTQTTTEKRVFVQAETTTPTTITTTTTTTEKPATSTVAHLPVVKISYKPKLPMTSAKLLKFGTKPATRPSAAMTAPPMQAFKIDVNEIFGLHETSSKAPDAPFKMVIDLEAMMPTEPPATTTRTFTTTVSTSLPYTEVLGNGEKLPSHVTAKEEIMEILKDPTDRAQLSRILQQRNMTVQELVEQRERGSSQLHLADIFHNNTREPEPQDEPFVGRISDGHVRQVPSMFRRPKSRPVEYDKLSFQTVTSRPTYTITSFPTYKIESSKSNMQTFLPFWKDLYPNSVLNSNSPVSATTTSPNLALPTDVHHTHHQVNEDDLQRLEDIENRILDSSSDRLNVEIAQKIRESEDEEDFINLPSGVKSAMLASFVIVGLSVLVFITILLIFKWNQKQKRRGLNYSGSFSGSKYKSPILEPPQRRSLRSIMTETLGRKKNYYKSHLQSMSDSIWDTEKSKSYM